MKKVSVTKSVKNNPYWNWAGDYCESIGFEEEDVLSIGIYSFPEFPDVSHIIPVEGLVGSRFNGSGVWNHELNCCKLLAYARVSTWYFCEPE